MRVAALWFAIWLATVGLAMGGAPMIQPPAPRVEGERWALLVAVDAYPDERILRSKGTIGASREIATLLVDRYGFSRTRIIELYDREATSTRIGDELRQLDARMSRGDSLFVLLGLASFDSPKEQTVSLVPHDGRLDAPWTLLPVSQIAATFIDLPANSLLAVFDGCASRWEFVLRQLRWSGARQQSSINSKADTPGRPLGTREFVTTCSGTGTTVRESQAGILLKWLQEPATPGEPRRGEELQKVLAGPLWSVDATSFGRGTGYSFILRTGQSDDLSLVADRQRPVDERGDAIERLGRLHATDTGREGSATAVRALRGITDSPAEPLALQQRAALALGQIPAQQSADALVRLALNDPSLELALTAVRALGGLPPALAIPALEGTLAAERPAVQRSALRALVSLSARDSLPRIATLLRDSQDSQVRLACLDALQAMGVEGVDVVPTLVALARDESDPDVCAAALRVLTQTNAPERAAVFQERLASGTSEVVRRAAAYALGDLLPSDPAEAALLGALGDAGAGVREAVVTVLWKAKTTRARDGLIGATRDAAGPVRIAAAESLGRLGDRGAIPPLQVMMRSTAPEERRAAATALGRLKAVESFSDLVRIATTDESEMVRASAESALEALLGSTGFKDARVDTAIADPSVDVRAAALRWLARSGGEEWLPRFRAALRSPDDEVRAAALDGLAAIGSPQSVEILVDEIRRSEGAGRDQVLRSLTRVRSPQVLEALLTLADPATADPAVIEALGGFDDERAITRATAWADTGNQRQRLAAADALQRQAQVLHEKGDTQRAVAIGERALAIHQRILGESHPEAATDLNNLGVMYLALGRLDDARARLTQALEIRRRIERPDPDLATTLGNLAAIAVRRGDYKEALDRYFQALEIRQYLLGKDSDEATATLYSIADVYEKLGDVKQAAAYRQQADSNKRRSERPAATAD